MIILTSESIRRKKILQQIGFCKDRDFMMIDIRVPLNYRQIKTQKEAIAQAADSAKLKIKQGIENIDIIESLKSIGSENVVLAGAVTVVYSNGNLYTRPSEIDPSSPFFNETMREQAEEKAREMLSQLRAQSFSIITGFALAQGNDPYNIKSDYVITEAKMKNYGEEEIEKYIATGEPLDKAGGFGIQEQGVVLFERIKGSYSNVVGLPIREFLELLQNDLFKERVEHRIADKIESATIKSPPAPGLSIVSVGDINYDLSYSQLPENFFANLKAPGMHIPGKLQRTTGGTAAIFALKAKEEKFKYPSVLGVIGGDPLGKSIEEKLNEEKISTILPANYKLRTSITLLLRDQSANDTLITITDARQELSVNDVEKAATNLKNADVVFLSGYCLTDPDRKDAALKVIELTKENNRLLVLDVHVDMDKYMSFKDFTKITKGKVDVLVAEITTIQGWLNKHEYQQDNWEFVKRDIVPELRKYFSTCFLRTSTYSHELIVSPTKKIVELYELDHSQVKPEERLGYGDKRTAHVLYQFMSPRILLASSSPRRLELLRQIIANNKIEFLSSDYPETYQEHETPKEIVKRLAREKAENILQRNQYSSSIEIVIGADTEIVLDDQILGKPKDDEDARNMLRRLSGKTHQAITGIAVINRKSGKTVNECVSTDVKFKILSDDKIEQYVNSGEPIGKAGAYGIQGKGAIFVEEIDGSYSNIVGLPLERLADILNYDFDMPIWVLDKVSNWDTSGLAQKYDSQSS